MFTSACVVCLSVCGVSVLTESRLAVTPVVAGELGLETRAERPLGVLVLS